MRFDNRCERQPAAAAFGLTLKSWKPEAMKGLIKQGKHEALSDILESIEELKYYRTTVMTI